MRLFAFILVALLLPLSGCGYRRAVMAEDHFNAGNQAIAKRAWEQAGREFAAAAEARPDSAALRARIGLAYEQAGRCGDAVPWLQEALDLQPRQSWLVRIALVTCLERIGRPRESEAVLRGALEVYRRRSDAVTLNNIGYTIADRGLHLDTAERLLRRAVEFEPDAGFIVDSLGWCAYKQDRLDEALSLMTRAAALEPSAEVLYHLGMVQAALGDPQAAAEQFGGALSMDPTYTPAFDALMALQPPDVEKPPATPVPSGPIMEQ